MGGDLEAYHWGWASYHPCDARVAGSDGRRGRCSDAAGGLDECSAGPDDGPDDGHGDSHMHLLRQA